MELLAEKLDVCVHFNDEVKIGSGNFDLHVSKNDSELKRIKTVEGALHEALWRARVSKQLTTQADLTFEMQWNYVVQMMQDCSIPLLLDRYKLKWAQREDLPADFPSSKREN